MKDRILLFIPAYNCGKQIERVLEQIDKRILMYVDEILVVNNQSKDQTEDKVAEWMCRHKEIPIILSRNELNYGLGGSHKIAFSYAVKNKFDYVIALHGDDQGDIKDILKLLETGEYREYDCCLGARFMKGSKLIGYSGHRIAGNKCFNLLFSMATGRKIYDLGSGLNLYSIKMLEHDFYYSFPDTLYFNDCMILAFCHFRQRILFFPITWREEDQISNTKLFSFSVSLLRMLYGYRKAPDHYLKIEMRSSPVTQYRSQVVKSYKGAEAGGWI